MNTELKTRIGYQSKPSAVKGHRLHIFKTAAGRAVVHSMEIAKHGSIFGAVLAQYRRDMKHELKHMASTDRELLRVLAPSVITL